MARVFIFNVFATHILAELWVHRLKNDFLFVYFELILLQLTEEFDDRLVHLFNAIEDDEDSDLILLYFIVLLLNETDDILLYSCQGVF